MAPQYCNYCSSLIEVAGYPVFGRTGYPAGQSGIRPDTKKGRIIRPDIRCIPTSGHWKEEVSQIGTTGTSKYSNPESSYIANTGMTLGTTDPKSMKVRPAPSPMLTGIELWAI
jgi:hypothetical protein